MYSQKRIYQELIFCKYACILSMFKIAFSPYIWLGSERSYIQVARMKNGVIFINYVKSIVSVLTQFYNWLIAASKSARKSPLAHCGPEQDKVPLKMDWWLGGQNILMVRLTEPHMIPSDCWTWSGESLWTKMDVPQCRVKKQGQNLNFDGRQGEKWGSHSGEFNCHLITS